MTKNKPIRILHLVSIMRFGGIEALLMNLFRNIDRDKFVFDFCTHSVKSGDYIFLLAG